KQSITASGVIEATEVDVSPKISGHIVKLCLKEGDKIKKGDVVALLDQEELNAQLNKALANLSVAVAKLTLLKAAPQPEIVKEAQEGVEQAKANLENAANNLNRMEGLFAQNAVPQKNLDDAKTLFETRQSQYDAAKERLKIIRIGARREEIDVAQQQLKVAEAEVELIRVKLKDTIVKSPVSGMVMLKLIEEGEFVLTGKPIVTIGKLDSVWLKVYVPESDLGRIRLNQLANVWVDSFPNKPFQGKVMEISSEAEFTPKHIQTKAERVSLVFGVKIGIENPELALKPGMPADARMEIVDSSRSTVHSPQSMVDG
ncbi:MAG: efflux RND transporter periplasmic adaptor subunit, partial [Candidatus Desantisbacteria bacterium]